MSEDWIIECPKCGKELVIEFCEAGQYCPCCKLKYTIEIKWITELSKREEVIK